MVEIIGAIIGILLLGALIAIFKYWLFIVGIGFFVWCFVSIVKDSKKRTLEEEARIQKKLVEKHKYEQKEREDKQKHENNQRYLLEICSKIISDVNKLHCLLFSNLTNAKTSIKNAEEEFVERAFNPFWDKIEKAVIDLGNFDLNVKKIESLSKEYSRNAAKLDSNRVPEPFDKNTYIIPSPSALVRELGAIVRVAQKDYQFATIFNQRKTNKILTSGFSTLSEAISEVKNTLQNSIESLSFAISDIGHELHLEFNSTISSLETITEELKDDAAEKRVHEKIERQLLDNIRRRKI